METSTISNLEAENTEKYRVAKTFRPNTSAIMMTLNVSFLLTFESSFNGFYLAFIDKGTCLTITRILILYYKGPEKTENLVEYPDTVAPPSGNSSVMSGTVVSGECVDKALGEVHTLTCYARGVWGVVQPGTKCHCSSGYEQSQEEDSCQSEG